MITLALDTATSCTVAAVLADGDVLASGGIVADRRQGEELIPLVQRVMHGVGVTTVDRVVVGVGPGPFTGLRVGLVTAEVLARVWNAALVGVCTLDALAYQARAERPGIPLVVATDARRQEVYWARYDVDGRRIGDAQVGTPVHVAAESAGQWVVAEGALRYRSVFEQAGCDVGGPEFVDAAALALALDDGAAVALPCLPLYLRRPDAAEPGPRKRVGS